MAKLKVKQIKSLVGGKSNQRNTIRTLGLKRIGQTVEVEDSPSVRGMIRAVAHLVIVEEAK